MKVAIFDTHQFEREYFDRINRNFNYDLTYFDFRLTEETARLVSDFDIVCSFVNDQLNAKVLQVIKSAQVKLIALRSVGFNHVDLDVASKLDLKIVRVPQYSPYAVAEHTVALILALNRKIYRSYSRVREGNFSLDGLVGFDLKGKTIGIVGTGKIGSVVAGIMNGFGCNVLAYDAQPNTELEGVTYQPTLSELYKKCDILSLHVPLTPETHHVLDASAFDLMKNGVMLINTGRGALIDTRALILALKSGKVGYAGLDVYEEEEKFFFRDLSNQVIQDDVLARLMTFPNVLITAHQAFLTNEALSNIAFTTLKNIEDFEKKRELKNQLTPKDIIMKAA
jgi:D-lactate dehydrogenase